MKLPAAATPSIRFPTDLGGVVAEAIVGWGSAGCADDSGRGTIGRDAEGDGTRWGTTDGAAGTDVGEVGGGGNGDELQPINAATVLNNPIHIRERNAAAMIHDPNE